MKTTTKIFLTLLVAAVTALPAAPVQLQEVGALPNGCQFVSEIKVGDVAGGYRSRTDVIEDVKKEAGARGGNFVSVDVKRVNNPKQGVYYWAWGTVGSCK